MFFFRHPFPCGRKLREICYSQSCENFLLPGVQCIFTSDTHQVHLPDQGIYGFTEFFHVSQRFLFRIRSSAEQHRRDVILVEFRHKKLRLNISQLIQLFHNIVKFLLLFDADRCRFLGNKQRKYIQIPLRSSLFQTCVCHFLFLRKNQNHSTSNGTLCIHLELFRYSDCIMIHVIFILNFTSNKSCFLCLS